MVLTPCSYSRGRKIENFMKHLSAYPEQLTNTIEAHRHSIELVPASNVNAPVGTLSEYFVFDRETTFVVLFSDSTSIKITRTDDGKFVVA